jgi:single-stranded-DNA-specific exonuclease
LEGSGDTAQNESQAGMNSKSVDSWLWYAPPLEQETVRLLQRELGIHRLTAACLIRLGITCPQTAGSFLNCDLQELAEPQLMSGMDQAAERLQLAVRRQEPVLICGDYDVDGVTSVALLTDCFRRLGLPAEYYIPGRLEEGYGLHSAPLVKWAGQAGRLAVTVDCGINSFAEMALARELGLDLIITDHHQPFAGERPAVAVLNPLLPGCAYPEKNLAGVGVAWTMVRELHRRCGVPEQETFRYLPLAALGTIADVAQLRGENRLIVYHGLAELYRNPSPGLAALLRRTRLNGAGFSAVQAAYALAPRLNAPGRLGDAVPAVRLLLASAQEADELAAELDNCNRRRQKVEADILAMAQMLAETQASEPALVLWHESWHPGVLGIVAGRLAEQYQRPVVLLTAAGEEAHGSARGVTGYNLVDRLSDCATLLLRFGGHPAAAGLTLETSKLELFRETFCRSMASYPEPSVPQQPVAAEAELAELSLELARELQRLQPFGEGNPEPHFLLNGMEIAAASFVGNGGKHLVLSVQEGNRQARAICFGATGRKYLPASGDAADLVIRLREDNWQGKSCLALHVSDLRSSRKREVGCSGSQAREYQLFDQRNLPEKERFIRQLSAGERLAVFVNTQAAQKRLQALAVPGRTCVIRRGEPCAELLCDAVVFYHLPYDRQAVEMFLAGLRFLKGPRAYLLYGREDLLLNENIFASCQPCAGVLYQLASVPPAERGRQDRLLNGRLLERALQVLEEIGTGEVERGDFEQLLCRSHTFMSGRQAVSRYRQYQHFWRQADVRDLAVYLREPAKYLLSEGEFYETRRFEGAS